MSVENLKYSSLENSIAEAQDQKLFEVQYLVIAGGGSGNRGGNSYSGNQGSGGGGAGGYISGVPGELTGTSLAANEPLQVEIGKDYKVKVGAGATNIYGEFGTGDSSYFDGIVATPGGGGGGIGFTNSFQQGGRGGSAGGGASNFTNGRHTIGQGGRPGNVTLGSGGGGAADQSDTSNRNGQPGLASSITGSSVTRGGGGGGRRQNSNTNHSGGAGGGGGTGNQYGPGGDGTVNTGGGGGAGGNGNGNNNRGAGGLGGSGVVILRYPKKYTITVGSGLTASAGEQTDGAEKYIEITAGSDNVSWS